MLEAMAPPKEKQPKKHALLWSKILPHIETFILAALLAHDMDFTTRRYLILCKVHEGQKKVTKKAEGTMTNRAHRGAQQAREHQTRGRGDEPEISEQ